MPPRAAILGNSLCFLAAMVEAVVFPVQEVWYETVDRASGKQAQDA